MMSEGKIFYLGFQRVGTKAFGRFMECNGFDVASWDVSSGNGWPELFRQGNGDAVLKSKSFQFYRVFEDGPWFEPEVVKFVFRRVPDARFVMLTRPPDDWFKSMITHSGGLTLGNVRRHCELYDRMDDYQWLTEHAGLTDDMRLSLFDKPRHYMDVYQRKTTEVIEFFEKIPGGASRFFCGELYDPEKYSKIAQFLEMENPLFLNSVVHKSAEKVEDVICSLNEAGGAALKQLRDSRRMQREGGGPVAEAREMLAVSPSNHHLLFRYANALFLSGDLGQSEAVVRKGLASGRHSPRMHVLLAKILARNGRLRDAVEHIETAIAITDDNPSFHHFRESLLVRLEKGALKEKGRPASLRSGFGTLKRWLGRRRDSSARTS